MTISTDSEHKEVKLNLHSSWLEKLGDEFNKPYMKKLSSFLVDEIKKGKAIYPNPTEYFSALNATPFNQVKVVILGQDPYHGPGQAHGLSFSVQPGVKLPPSLRNIFKEMRSDLGIEQPNCGYLMPWATQGVLLLNAVLSVEASSAGSHQGKGWEIFTDAIIASLNEGAEGLIFLLWGSYAQKKGQIIDRDRHHVFEAPHPSPLSAHRGFFGSSHFSAVNKTLASKGQQAIDWQL